MTFSTKEQEHFIRLAMDQAQASIDRGGNPFGAILVDEHGEVVAAANNTVTPQTDILQHAELNLLRAAHERTRQKQFPGCSVFINAASCAMCASALVQAGIRNFYYGAPFEPHTNPALSYAQLAEYCREPLNIHEGILADECRSQIAQGRQAPELPIVSDQSAS